MEYELTFEENSSNSYQGVTATIGNEDDKTKFRFDPLKVVTGSPSTMEIKLPDTLFMVVDFMSAYLGKPFEIEIDGMTYKGKFKAGDSIFQVK